MRSTRGPEWWPSSGVPTKGARKGHRKTRTATGRTSDSAICAPRLEWPKSQRAVLPPTGVPRERRFLRRGGGPAFQSINCTQQYLRPWTTTATGCCVAEDLRAALWSAAWWVCSNRRIRARIGLSERARSIGIHPLPMNIAVSGETMLIWVAFLPPASCAKASFPADLLLFRELCGKDVALLKATHPTLA